MITSMPLTQHLIELRNRLMISIGVFILASAIAYPFSEIIFDFLLQPLADAYGENSQHRLIYTHLAEAFFVYLKLSMLVGFLISAPVIICQVYLFLAPGLYKKEKRVVLPYLFATPVLFILGASFVYYLVIPNAWKFFLSFESIGSLTHVPIQLEAKINEYLSLMIQLIIAFGLCFQLPIFMILLANIGAISSQSLRKTRKYAFIGILIVSAFLTPPDVFSMLGLAAPLYLLYELSIGLIIFTEKREKKAASHD